jgi:type I restriction enzyme R subunit
MEPLLPFHLFDRDADVRILQRRLPHWSQAGTACFITWRTHDSMPRAVVDEWYADRARWLRAHGIDADDPNWRQKLENLTPHAPREERGLARVFLDTFWNRWHDALDACHGARVLRRAELARIVANSLRHFDDQRYLLTDFVVMPNHVHVLASFPDERAMLTQCESWKHFTAMQINRRLGQKGRFWQQDAFDHLVRSEEQFEYLRRYIADNPDRARLRQGEYIHYSRVQS